MVWSRRALVLAAITALLILVSLLYGLSSHVLLVQVASGPRVLTSQLSALLYRRTNPPSPKLGSAEPFVRRIVAVGDLHASMPNAEQVLRFSKVVDEKGNWTGNVDFFVQVGDIIDRGPDTIKLFDWMDKLREQAKLKEDEVILLLGNHEFMNLRGAWNPKVVLAEEIKTFGDTRPLPLAERAKMLTTGRIGQSWADHYISASRLPLHPSLGRPNTPYSPPSVHLHLQKDGDTIHEVNHPLSHAALAFVHGGLSPTYSCLTPFPSRINDISKTFLVKLQNELKVDGNKIPRYPSSDFTPDEKEFYGPRGPLWYRGWTEHDDDTDCHLADDVLAKIGTRRMIMGHTRTNGDIVTRCKGKLIFIDTDISTGKQAALSITYSLTPIGDKSGGEQRWIEEEIVEALYPKNRKVKLVADKREVVGDFRVTKK